MNPRIAIVGCGLIGKKRAATLAPGQLVVTCDSNPATALALAKTYSSANSFTDFHQAVEHPSVDAVIVATPNAFLSQVSLAALEAGKHVLVEKPAAIHLHEIEELAQKAAEKKLILRVGFNHRYHPAFLKAREIFESGVLGTLMMIRSRYGHGGRIGYDQEWRADPAISGGGELIDQGVHLIDLARWFLGEFTTVEGHVTTSFWKMPVDDNAFLSLRRQALAAAGP